MIGTKRLALGLVLLLLAAAAWSQPAADGDSETAPATSAQNPVAGGNTEDKGADTAPAAPARSPTDYRSSEKISEDLSVSFPVDI
jgi:hypothetical protein